MNCIINSRAWLFPKAQTYLTNFMDEVVKNCQSLSLPTTPEPEGLLLCSLIPICWYYYELADNSPHPIFVCNNRCIPKFPKVIFLHILHLFVFLLLFFLHLLFSFSFYFSLFPLKVLALYSPSQSKDDIDPFLPRLFLASLYTRSVPHYSSGCSAWRNSMHVFYFWQYFAMSLIILPSPNCLRISYGIFLLLLTIRVIYQYQVCFKTRYVYWEDINENCS